MVRGSNADCSKLPSGKDDAADVMGSEITRLLAQARDGEPARLSAVFEALFPS